jgi:hypothetical protein
LRWRDNIQAINLLGHVLFVCQMAEKGLPANCLQQPISHNRVYFLEQRPSLVRSLWGICRSRTVNLVLHIVSSELSFNLGNGV